MPTPWPHPPPSTVTVSPELDSAKRSEGNAMGRSPGVGRPLPLALAMKSPAAMLCVVAGAVVGGVVGGALAGVAAAWPGAAVVGGVEVVGDGGDGWRTWYTMRSFARLAD